MTFVNVRFLHWNIIFVEIFGLQIVSANSSQIHNVMLLRWRVKHHFIKVVLFESFSNKNCLTGLRPGSTQIVLSGMLVKNLSKISENNSNLEI